MFKIFKKKSPVFIKSKYKWDLSFEMAGEKFYECNDLFNLPYTRGLAALRFYEELRMRCTHEYLIEHCKEINKCINNGKKVDLARIFKLNNQLEERLKFIIEPDLVYKLAGVAFISEFENPAVYDQKEADRKIALWKKHSSVNDFFLSKPLKKLIPFLNNVEVDLGSYSQAVTLINTLHWGNLSTSHSKEPQTETAEKK